MGSNDASKPFIEKFDYEKLDLEDPVDDNVSQTSKLSSDRWEILD
jgi:hypothetical protein